MKTLTLFVVFVFNVLNFFSYYHLFVVVTALLHFQLFLLF